MKQVDDNINGLGNGLSVYASKKKAVHFGGGNVGRGFVGVLLTRSNYEVVFVEVNEELLKKFSSIPSYTVTELGANGETQQVISGYRAINSRTNKADVIAELTTADIVTCAVGANILKFIGPVIAKGINARRGNKPMAVIACENMIGSTDSLYTSIEPNLSAEAKFNLHSRARFANSAIDRIIPQQDLSTGLDVKLECFYEWCVESTPFTGAKGGVPSIDGVHFVENLQPYIERKLFTVNTGHATAAYYGHYLGIRTIHEAMAHPVIRRAVERALEETSTLVIDKHGIQREEQEEYVSRIISRISNPHLNDAVERVGRCPLRKLGRKERFIGPAAELAERGESVEALMLGLEMCLRFQGVGCDEESRELERMIEEMSAERFVREVCGLGEGDKVFGRVVEVVRKVMGEK